MNALNAFRWQVAGAANLLLASQGAGHKVHGRAPAAGRPRSSTVNQEHRRTFVLASAKGADG